MDAASAEHRDFLGRAAELPSSSPEFDDDALAQTKAAAEPALGDADDDAAKTAPAPLPEPRPSPDAAPRVLVVDDNADAAEAMADFLAMVGFEARFATDPEVGLALVDAFHPEIAILDIGLPRIDGYALAEQIRAATAGRCRLIAVTGYGLAEDRARTHAAGFESHFVKPVDLDRLVDALRAR